MKSFNLLLILFSIFKVSFSIECTIQSQTKVDLSPEDAFGISNVGQFGTGEYLKYNIQIAAANLLPDDNTFYDCDNIPLPHQNGYFFIRDLSLVSGTLQPHNNPDVYPDGVEVQWSSSSSLLQVKRGSIQPADANPISLTVTFISFITDTCTASDFTVDNDWGNVHSVFLPISVDTISLPYRSYVTDPDDEGNRYIVSDYYTTSCGETSVGNSFELCGSSVKISLDQTCTGNNYLNIVRHLEYDIFGNDYSHPYLSDLTIDYVQADTKVLVNLKLDVQRGYSGSLATVPTNCNDIQLQYLINEESTYTTVTSDDHTYDVGGVEMFNQPCTTSGDGTPTVTHTYSFYLGWVLDRVNPIDHNGDGDKTFILPFKVTGLYDPDSDLNTDNSEELYDVDFADFSATIPQTLANELTDTTQVTRITEVDFKPSIYSTKDSQFCTLDKHHNTIQVLFDFASQDISKRGRMNFHWIKAGLTGLESKGDYEEPANPDDAATGWLKPINHLALWSGTTDTLTYEARNCWAQDDNGGNSRQCSATNLATYLYSSTINYIPVKITFRHDNAFEVAECVANDLSYECVKGHWENECINSFESQWAVQPGQSITHTYANVKNIQYTVNENANVGGTTVLDLYIGGPDGGFVSEDDCQSKCNDLSTCTHIVFYKPETTNISERCWLRTYSGALSADNDYEVHTKNIVHTVAQEIYEGTITEDGSTTKVCNLRFPSMFKNVLGNFETLNEHQCNDKSFLDVTRTYPTTINAIEPPGDHKFDQKPITLQLRTRDLPIGVKNIRIKTTGDLEGVVDYFIDDAQYEAAGHTNPFIMLCADNIPTTPTTYEVYNQATDTIFRIEQCNMNFNGIISGTNLFYEDRIFIHPKIFENINKRSINYEVEVTLETHPEWRLTNTGGRLLRSLNVADVQTITITHSGNFENLELKIDDFTANTNTISMDDPAILSTKWFAKNLPDNTDGRGYQVFTFIVITISIILTGLWISGVYETMKLVTNEDKLLKKEEEHDKMRNYYVIGMIYSATHALVFFTYSILIIWKMTEEDDISTVKLLALVIFGLLVILYIYLSVYYINKYTDAFSKFINKGKLLFNGLKDESKKRVKETKNKMKEKMKKENNTAFV